MIDSTYTKSMRIYEAFKPRGSVRHNVDISDQSKDFIYIKIYCLVHAITWDCSPYDIKTLFLINSEITFLK